MPGLVGIVNFSGDRIDLGLISAMRDAIRHQDWYGTDDYVNVLGTVAISRVNLGVINRERQPCSVRNDQVKIFLHGEILNDEVAHSSPLEFIYRLYEKSGLDFAASLSGSFIVVIVDEREGVVIIANDRIATKPLFCFNDGRAMYFSPEMKSLFLVPALERKLNMTAVADFLTNGHFTCEHTFIDGLETLENATVLKVTSGGVARHRYWQFENEQGGKDRGRDYYEPMLAELLRNAVGRCLRSDGSHGVLLSGGYDSRAILGCYLEKRPDEKLNTISWGRAGDIPDSDCVVARKLAQKLGARHRFYKLTAEDVIDDFQRYILLGEGLTDFPESYDVFHSIREQQHVDIVLRGDECFGFSRWLKVHDEHTMFLSLSLKSLRNTEAYQRILKPPYYQLFCECDAETVRRVSSRCSAKDIHNRKDFFYLDVRTRYYLNPLNHVKNFAVESFRPFLDYDILDFVSVLPVSYRLGKRFYRETVVKMFPELYEEIASMHNMIDWASSFKGSADLKRFVYKELIEEQGILGEFIDVDRLHSDLDAFFAVAVDSPVGSRLRRGALELLQTSPSVYNFAHKCSYHVQKRRGKIRNVLPLEQLIIRLLTLKVWGDVFLNYPVVTALDHAR